MPGNTHSRAISIPANLERAFTMLDAVGAETIARVSERQLFQEREMELYVAAVAQGRPGQNGPLTN